MTPKEKAKELVEKFEKIRNYTSYATPLCKSAAKQCALIAVDCIFSNCYEDMEEYWESVKQEIEKI